MSFSIKNNKIFSNLHGRFVLTPDNPIYSGLVSSNNFIVKRDMIADSIKTSELELIGLCDEQKPKSSGFRINNDKIVHDIIMPKTISDELILLNPPYIFGDFGDSVSISGDTCIVGSPGYDGASTNQGAAYIYSKVDGVWVQDGPTLIGQNLEDRFGDSVAIYGDTCVVGAPLYNGGGADKGAAYIYNKVDGSWVQDGPTLIGQNNNDFFGSSVAIYGDTCIVGAPGYITSSFKGAVYIYNKVNGSWVQDGLLGQPTLIGQNGGDNFGYSVAIHGYTCIVGAYLYGDGSDQGAAYIYSKVNGIWIQDGPTLIGQNSHDAFGRSVGISEDTCIVGAYTYDGGSNNKGAVYIYSKVNGDWVQEGLLGQPTLIGQTTDNLFGYSVAISGYTCVVGAFGYNGTNNGGVYIFTLVDGHWVQNRLIVGDNNAIGISCAISCNTAIIGAASDNAYIVEGVLYKSDIQH